MLDTYVDTWMTQNFDDAFVKIKQLLQNYPDDAEIRTLYALFVDVFQQDTTTVYAQFDTVLETYPSYVFALENYAAVLQRHKQFERAADLTERVAKMKPLDTGPRRTLAELNYKMGRVEKAEKILNELAEDFPEELPVLSDLIDYALVRHDFVRAREYAERQRKLAKDDPYAMASYWSTARQPLQLGRQFPRDPSVPPQRP